MAKAHMGTHTTPRAIQLLDEVRALRARVAELEERLARAEAVAEARDAEGAVAGTEPEPAAARPGSTG